MKKEDRMLLNELNEKIAGNPRLYAYRLAHHSRHLMKEPLLKSGMLGFATGVLFAWTGFILCSLPILQGNVVLNQDSPSAPPANTPTKLDKQSS
ncbi:hypothetical protein IQ249_22195 [Lusitaniella coriacea LEGE 07157]|uniref:Uncharacterized protein n=1 Tax=Lusitaniella coriacea LEGE 07157 TaxID=945747 RepID=A0A8J7E5E2_9CYAN|nr:hypothetical protein [Lusitaniella coriacea]MBE9118604.1 hypothetical protein [Lusitaniella coriacea LEGE 07157]